MVAPGEPSRVTADVFLTLKIIREIPYVNICLSSQHKVKEFTHTHTPRTHTHTEKKKIMQIINQKIIKIHPALQLV